MDNQDKIIFFILFVVLITSLVFLLIEKGGFLGTDDSMFESDIESSFLKKNPLTTMIKTGEFLISGGGKTNKNDEKNDEKNMKITLQQDINPCLHAFFAMKLSKLRSIDPDIDKKTLILFHYADWCPYCIEMKGPWNEVKFKLLKNKEYRFEEQNEEQCKTIGVNIIPTIFKIKDRHVCRYRGPKAVKELEEWILSP
jgi:thiol-disulfide isomerase/thioredoxin